MNRSVYAQLAPLSLLLINYPASGAQAQTVVPVTFTKLTGVTGGSPAATAIYRAELTGIPLTTIQSITINDNSSGLGGAPGRFSGFDLDAIKLSTTSVASASAARTLTGLNLFDFTPAGTLFTPGNQRPPVDPALFGTIGGHIDNSVATLGAFDANSSTGSDAFGFASMGDNGRLSFNLTNPVPVAGLFIYIGEVGDNGEVAAGSITVSSGLAGVPEPGALALFTGIAIPGAFLLSRRRK